MDALLIEGPATLKGEVAVSGSKNSALPLLFSALLFDKPVHFRNVPRLWDIETTLKLLDEMGTRSEWDKEQGTVCVYPEVRHKVAPYEWVRRMRAGILALGPLVARHGEAKVSLPGGCAIGARPVDYHLNAMRKMGVEVAVEEGYIKAQVRSRLVGAAIDFPQVTVTGTENLLILAACAEGETVMTNCAREPEVVTLGEVLQDAGATIEGLGTDTIRVRGAHLQPPKRPIDIPPDRIETGTWIAASVGTRSSLRIRNCDTTKLASVIDVYRRMGVKFEIAPDGTEFSVIPPEKLLPVEIETQPYPGFPTDMQAQLLTNLCLAEGRSQIRETIFENRFMHVAELRRLGARIEIDGNLATIDGPCELTAAPMIASDLRASASLVVAALCARGKTKVSRIYHLDRGYQRLDEKLRHVGAQITRIAE